MLPELSSLFDKLQQEREGIETLVEGALEGALDLTGPGAGEGGGWSARETLAHVVSSEHGMLALARAIVSGHGDALPPAYDVHAENAKAVAKRRGLSAADLLLEWERGRTDWRAFLESVTPGQLEMCGIHPASPLPMSLRAVVIVMLRHDRGHRKQMAALLGDG
jgi:hypothetical protein